MSARELSGSGGSSEIVRKYLGVLKRERLHVYNPCKVLFDPVGTSLGAVPCSALFV